MSSRTRRAWITAGMLVLFVRATSGIYVDFETRTVPVARLVANLEQQLEADPKRPEIHLRLARLYGMAYSLNSDELPARVTRPGGAEEVWFGHEAPLVPYSNRVRPGATRSEASRTYLKKSLEHYRAALALDQESLLAHLGYGWTLQQTGDLPGAIAEYRVVIERAWLKEQHVKGIMPGGQLYTSEAAGYLIPLLDLKRDAAEIAELRKRVDHLQRLPRAITPIAVALEDNVTPQSVVDLDAKVPFDADGSGQRRQWTWISGRAGWLVYDADRSRRVTSALQLFGNVTFWVMWKNGYEPLAALDDDRDGRLRGAELRHLAIWIDKDRDGISDAGEVRALADHGITELSCQYTAGDGLLTAALSARGAHFRDGRVRPTFDVILRRAIDVSAP